MSDLGRLVEIPASGFLPTLANQTFAELSPYRGPGLRNHCLRLYQLATVLVRRQRLAMDPDLLYAVTMFHDLGLVAAAQAGETYMERSATLFEQRTARLELNDRDRELARQCLLYNHRVLPTAGVRAETECFRQAVWIEHSRGLRRYGLPRSLVKEVFARHPREDFDVVLVDFARRVIGREPSSLIRGIFF